jgi:hypothetical protein
LGGGGKKLRPGWSGLHVNARRGEEMMPQRWLQVKGDPSVRAFLFEQSRVESLFDSKLDRIHEVVRLLLTRKGAFHVKVHYSSSQLTCWF